MSKTDVGLALEALEQAGRSEELRQLPFSGPSVPSPLRHVLKAVEASMNAVDREEEAVVTGTRRVN